jgi:hypothetical protein
MYAATNIFGSNAFGGLLLSAAAFGASCAVRKLNLEHSFELGFSTGAFDLARFEPSSVPT